jgi:hypothetical protein
MAGRRLDRIAVEEHRLADVRRGRRKDPVPAGAGENDAPTVCDVEFVRPRSLVTVSVTLNEVPDPLKVCVAVLPDPVVPSPNDHA